MKVLETLNLYSTKWLKFNYKKYIDKNNNERKWEYIERVNDRKAVCIIPYDKKNKKVLLIKQYRIPFENYVIEFPAGLIDEGETITESALRELKEETGFTGEIISISPQLSTSPGLTNESIYIVEVNIDFDNKDLIEEQNLEYAEDIEILIFDISDCLNKLRELSNKGYIIDSKVWAYFLNKF